MADTVKSPSVIPSRRCNSHYLTPWQRLFSTFGNLGSLSPLTDAQVQQAEMDAAIAAAQRASDQRPMHRFVKAMRVTPAGGSELGLLIRSVDTELYQSQASPRVIIYVSNPQQDNIAHEQLIERLFGLTRTEAIVASLLCNDFTLAQTATKLDVAENTARVYSKQIWCE